MDPTGYAEWYEKDQEALLQIIVTLKMEGQNCMHNMQTSKECWDRLADQYEGEGNQQIIYLLEKLLMTPFLNTEPMQVQLNALTMTTQQLKVAGLSVDDKLLAFLIVLRLPDSYVMLKTVLSSLDSTKATSKGMTSQILAEECRRICSSGGDIVAFYVKAKKGNKPQHPERNKKKCSHCKKKGHKLQHRLSKSCSDYHSTQR